MEFGPIPGKALETRTLRQHSTEVVGSQGLVFLSTGTTDFSTSCSFLEVGSFTPRITMIRLPREGVGRLEVRAIKRSKLQGFILSSISLCDPRHVTSPIHTSVSPFVRG